MRWVLLIKWLVLEAWMEYAERRMIALIHGKPSRRQVRWISRTDVRMTRLRLAEQKELTKYF